MGPLVALVLIFAVSASLRFGVARGFDPPWIAPDETIYALLGRSLWEDGSPRCSAQREVATRWSIRR